MSSTDQIMSQALVCNKVVPEKVPKSGAIAPKKPIQYTHLTQSFDKVLYENSPISAFFITERFPILKNNGDQATLIGRLTGDLNSLLALPTTLLSGGYQRYLDFAQKAMRPLEAANISSLDESNIAIHNPVHLNNYSKTDLVNSIFIVSQEGVLKENSQIYASFVLTKKMNSDPTVFDSEALDISFEILFLQKGLSENWWAEMLIQLNRQLQIISAKEKIKSIRLVVKTKTQNIQYYQYLGFKKADSTQPSTTPHTNGIFSDFVNLEASSKDIKKAFEKYISKQNHQEALTNLSDIKLRWQEAVDDPPQVFQKVFTGLGQFPTPRSIDRITIEKTRENMSLHYSSTNQKSIHLALIKQNSLPLKDGTINLEIGTKTKLTYVDGVASIVTKNGIDLEVRFSCDENVQPNGFFELKIEGSLVVKSQF